MSILFSLCSTRTASSTLVPLGTEVHGTTTQCFSCSYHEISTSIAFKSTFWSLALSTSCRYIPQSKNAVVPFVCQIVVVEWVQLLSHLGPTKIPKQLILALMAFSSCHTVTWLGPFLVGPEFFSPLFHSDGATIHNTLTFHLTVTSVVNMVM